jgi:hypothetical protein
MSEREKPDDHSPILTTGVDDPRHFKPFLMPVSSQRFTVFTLRGIELWDVSATDEQTRNVGTYL